MQELIKHRTLWLDAYYSGDHHRLRDLESDDFFIEQNKQVDKSKQRYQHIAHMVKHKKWQPERLTEKEVKFNKISDIEYLVTGTAFSNAITIEFKEKWLIEQQRWCIVSLVMISI